MKALVLVLALSVSHLGCPRDRCANLELGRYTEVDHGEVTGVVVSEMVVAMISTSEGLITIYYEGPDGEPHEVVYSWP